MPGRSGAERRRAVRRVRGGVRFCVRSSVRLPSSSVGVPSSSPVPENPEAALAGLAAAERELSDRRAKALLEVPGEVARLMASVAAAGAGHAYMLTEGAK